MASAWGASWGSAWGDSWGTVSASASVTSAGRRSIGTQYRSIPLSRELREKEKAARKAARKIRTRVVAALESEPWFASPEAAKTALAYVKTEIAETVIPQLVDEGVGQQIMAAAVEALIKEATDRAIEEQDDELLLLAA